MQQMKETVRKARRGAARAIYGRTAILVVLILLQVLLLVGLFSWLSAYLAYFYTLAVGISILVTLNIVSGDGSPSFKISWLIFIMAVPILGICFYLFLQNQAGTYVIREKLRVTLKETAPYLKQDYYTREEMRERSPRMDGVSSYAYKCGGYPTYRHSPAIYYPTGEEKFAAMLEALETAREFIFLEYFIVDEGIMWDTMLEVLARKVKEGVEVRFMYDGMNQLARLPVDYPKHMKALGIDCRVFMKPRPLLSTIQNNRDHRKILVIDGRTAFTGGINLADEYINKRPRFGYWKDTGVRIEGEAVNSFTIMFLQMWNVAGNTPQSYERYIRHDATHAGQNHGYIIPYGDSPFDNENVGEMIYLDILGRAENYVYIFTPYLILDREMTVALCFAAKRGVDVRLVLPHIPDKKYAYELARTHYKELLAAGIKIYEYRPGFVHAKVFVSDDVCCTVGTINLDFRSLYLNYECGVYFHDAPIVADVRGDLEQTMRRCLQITAQEHAKYPLTRRLIGKFLRLAAPLM